MIRSLILSLVAILLPACVPGKYFYYAGDISFRNGSHEVFVGIEGIERSETGDWQMSEHHPVNRPAPRMGSGPGSMSGQGAGFVFMPSYGVRAGDREPKSFKVHEVSVSFEEGDDLQYIQLEFIPGQFRFREGALAELWVPPSFPVNGSRVPSLAEGEYHIEIRYSLDGSDYSAHWNLENRDVWYFETWEFPTS